LEEFMPIFRLLFSFIVPVLLILAIVRWALQAWKSSEVEDRIDHIRQEEKISHKIMEIDPEEARENHEEIEDFLQDK